VIKSTRFGEMLRRLRHPREPDADRRSRFRKRGVSIAASAFMASCEGTMTTDLETQAPVDSNLQQVVVPLLGVEFRKSDGGTERLELTDAELIDLLDTLDGNSLRLFTDEELPTGDYNGVRLLFDEQATDDGNVIDSAGSERPLAFTSGDYAEISFSVDEEESSNESLTLTLDLRLSLSVNDADEYTLDPVLRSVPTEQASELQGIVTGSCAAQATSVNAAVYLFQGQDVTPDDRDNQDIEPYATAPVLLTSASGASYSIRSLPTGTYTVALACDGDEEDPTTDDELDFRGSTNIEIGESETVQQDLST
jgi:hypothetical protein